MDETKAANYRNKFLGFVFQSFNLINYKNALDNVILPLYYQGISRKVREKKALKYLSDVGLKNWSHHLPNELSGGQKQRVAIARAMVSEPKVLLADEPTGALDSNTSKEVMDLIQKINKAGKTILVVTHEHDISQMCSRIVKLKDGVIVEDKKIKQNFIANVNNNPAAILTTKDTSWVSRPYNQETLLFNELWYNNYKYVVKDISLAFKETTKYMDLKPTYIDNSLVYD